MTNASAGQAVTDSVAVPSHDGASERLVDERASGDNASMGRQSIDELLARARRQLQRVPPETLPSERAAGALVIDTRPAEQRERDGELPGGIVVDRNVLEWRLDPASPHRISEVTNYDVRIILVCNEGYSSSLAAATLQELGLHRATDLIGGYQAWRAAASSNPAPKSGAQPW
jgi:rhodanese-related sulfurtransferase